MPTIRSPEGRDTPIRVHPFETPLAASERLPQSSAGTHCTCPGWCEGRASRHWASCSSGCRHCNPPPPKRRRRGQATNEVGELEAGG
jgi:hypothetical protein